jgi:glycosyltransferase involved in cell wall biosynthesis
MSRTKNSADMPRVSVIIPNYNRADLIGETIENFLAQTLSPAELIVVDDGSTDDSVAVIKKFGSQIKLICQPNQGPGAARNAGLKVATGDYIQFFDSDDLCSLNKLEAQVKSLECSGADIAYSPWVPARIELRQVHIEKHVFQQHELPQKVNSLTCFLRGWVSVFQALLFRRSFLQGVGNYRTDLMPSEDSEFLFRMLLKQPKMRFCSDCLVLYRSHSGGQITGTGTSSIHRAQDWCNFMRIVESQLLEHKIQLDSFTQLKFAVRKWNSVQYLSNLLVSSSMQDIDPAISISPYQSLTFQIFDFLEKFVSRARIRARGAGYPPSYGTNWITPQQLQLIREIGYVPICKKI